MKHFNNEFKKIGLTKSNFIKLYKYYEDLRICPNCGHIECMFDKRLFYCTHCKWLNPCDEILTSNDFNTIEFRIDMLYELNYSQSFIDTIINDIVKIPKDTLTKSAYKIRKQLYKKSLTKEKTKPLETQQCLF